MGSIPGVIAGAFAIAFLPEYLRDAAAGETAHRWLNTLTGGNASDITEYRVLLFGARPGGDDDLPAPGPASPAASGRPSWPRPGEGRGLAATVDRHRTRSAEDDADADERRRRGGRPRPDAEAAAADDRAAGRGRGGRDGARARRAYAWSSAAWSPSRTSSLDGARGARSSGSSGPTARARPRCSTASPGCSGPTGGRHPPQRQRRSSAAARTAITEAGVARTFQNIRLFPNMTALENVMVGADARHRTSVPGALLGLPRHRREEREGRAEAQRLLDYVGIGHRAERPGPQPALRRPAPAGDRPGHRHRPERAAARRAGGGHEPVGEAGADRPDPPASATRASPSCSSSTTWAW